MIYINKTAYNNYVELEEALDKENNFVGETWEDYQNGAWLLLSDEQIAFHESNPNASIKEVWDMEIIPVAQYIRTVNDAKTEMLHRISMYDRSDNINDFIINNEIHGWFTPEERSNYKSSIDAAKLLNVEKLSFYIKDILLEITPQMAEQMLAMIQLYADSCFIVTKQHKLAIENICNSEIYSDSEKMDLIDSYDYTQGYPEKLNFEL